MLFDRGYAKDVPLLGKRFSALYRFKVIDPQRSLKVPKNDFFEEKRHLNGKLHQNFATKRFMPTMIHVFPPSFAEIGKAGVTKRVRGIHHKKSWYFTPLSGASGAISSKILSDHFSPVFHPSAKFSPNPSSFRGYVTYPKMSSMFITISA